MPLVEEPSSGLWRQSLAVTEFAPVPMAALRETTHIICYANPAFCELLGKPLEELVGKPLGVFLPKNDGCVALLDRVYRTGKLQTHTGQIQRTGDPLLWSYSAWPVRDGEHIAGIMLQVNETVQYHESMLAMNEALVLGSLRQHEWTDAAESLNRQLRLEVAERTRAEEAARESGK